jgi:hypothetical protein
MQRHKMSVFWPVLGVVVILPPASLIYPLLGVAVTFAVALITSYRKQKPCALGKFADTESPKGACLTAELACSSADLACHN